MTWFFPYGSETVAQWRWCIGREIGTKGHWRGSKMEFFEHYRNTERAIHSVLPNAKVGTHFLWTSSKNSFGPDFVRWCKRHRVRYDFIGVSYYPFYHKENRVKAAVSLIDIKHGNLICNRTPITARHHGTPPTPFSHERLNNTGGAPVPLHRLMADGAVLPASHDQLVPRGCRGVLHPNRFGPVVSRGHGQWRPAAREEFRDRFQGLQSAHQP